MSKGKNEAPKKNKLQRAYRRMPWYMAPKKDVTSCEKLRRVANERLTRRYPNEETQHE